MKKVRIVLENSEDDFDLLCTCEGFDKTMNGGEEQGDMAIEAYAMAIAGIIASIPADERPRFIFRFVSQVMSLSKAPGMKCESIKSVSDIAKGN